MQTGSIINVVFYFTGIMVGFGVGYLLGRYYRSLRKKK